MISVRLTLQNIIIFDSVSISDVGCVSLPDPDNGQYRITSDSVGGSLSVDCDQGYAPTLPNSATCQNSGNWSRPTPTCTLGKDI